MTFRNNPMKLASCISFLYLVFVSQNLIAQNSFLLHDINLVDVTSGTVIPNQSLTFSNGVITAVGSSGEFSGDTFERVISGSDYYVMPGLVDAHVHFNSSYIPLFLANGITTVFDLNGTPETVELKKQIANGEVIAPDIFISSPLLAGTEQAFAYQRIDNAEEGREAVVQAHEIGYDFIKVYDGLSAESYEAIISTSAELGIPTTGHIPPGSSLEQILSDGYLMLQHVEQIARATVGRSFDQAQIPTIVSQISQSTTAITPTIAAMEVLSNRRSLWFDSLYEREEMRFAPESLAGWWQSFRAPESNRSQLLNTPEGGSNREVDFYRALTRSLQDAGVVLLAGTDTPNPLLVPGYSLQHELYAMQRAGLSNAEILASATLNPGKIVAPQIAFGEVISGYQADLLVLNSNPLEDLSALEDIVLVVVNGQVLDQTSLATGLEVLD